MWVRAYGCVRIRRPNSCEADVRIKMSVMMVIQEIVEFIIYLMLYILELPPQLISSFLPRRPGAESMTMAFIL